MIILAIFIICAGVLAALCVLSTPAPEAPVPVATPQPRLCSCTDGGRNQAVIGCPHCRGEGWVR